MSLRLCLAVVCLACALSGARAQSKSATLFTVGGTPVTVEEFDYIYRKTNADSADYSRESLEEYLDLYKRFKLKVAKAKALGLDTVPALQQELEGYRRQLADSYLTDQQVTEPLARELHERRKTDISVLHIAVNLPEAGTDTTAAYQEIAEARERVEAGEMWGKVARDLSDDPSAARNNGEIGFVTAPLPEGLYALENAVYATAPGQISEIVRSDRAYHIVKVLDRRPARGEIEAAHIFVRKDPDDPGRAKERIDSIYAALEGGAEYETLARTLSEDSRSAPRGGYIGFFGIGRYEPAFEDAAFGIERDGAYAPPIETRVGWHILKRVSARQPGDYASAETELEARVKRMPRFEDGRRAMVKKLQREYGFTVAEPVISRYIASLPDTFLNYRWRPAPVDEATVLTFGGTDEVPLSAFTDYLRANSSQRVRLEGVLPVQEAARQLFDAFVEDQTLVYAEARLDRDNPAFYNLMREYEEGILLFEATKVNVWDKAGQDTVGLERFFANHRDRYRWDERVGIDVYSIPLHKQDELYDPVVKYARKHSPTEVLEKFNTTDSVFVRHHERTVERGREPTVDRVQWKRGTIVPPEIDEARQVLRFGVIREVMPAGPKELREARGYVIADYQDELERRWVDQLAKEYPVRVDGAVLESMIR